MTGKWNRWIAAAALVLACMSAPHAGILTGSFSGKAFDSAMYVGPEGPWYPEPVSFDGETVTGTFSLHTGNFIRLWHDDTTAIFNLPPFELDFYAAGHHLSYSQHSGLFTPYLALTQTDTYQTIAFNFTMQRGSVTFMLSAAPDELFTDLNPNTLHAGIVDLANSVAGFEFVLPGLGSIISSKIALDSVVFDSQQVPAPDSLLLAGLGLMALGAGLRRTRHRVPVASAD